MPNVERSGWRDEWISRRHRTWGYDMPAVDVDFILSENKNDMPKALIEYKESHAMRCLPDSYQYKALRNLADMAHLPLFGCRYTIDEDNPIFIIVPMNDEGRKLIQNTQNKMHEKEYIDFLKMVRSS